MRLQHPNFKECFSSWRRGFQGNGWEGHKFMRKLQFVKAKLKGWNKDSFGDLKERKKSILNEIAKIDAVEQEGVKEGDCNSKFFHKVANGRRNRKFIKFLENGRGLVLNNSESITEEILLYFEKLYSSPLGESWRVEGLDWSPISEESTSRLDSLFTKEEIYKTIFQLHRDKAPGSDGFTIAVFQDCWDVIKEDLVRVFAEFHKRRQILDAYLIANEIVDEKRRSGEEGVVFKIDFEKAYDHVILMNGNVKGWVKATKGLRQGDPLSPFLFTIVANVLSRMLLRAEERSLLEGFRVGRNRTRVSHLQFADDNIFFSNTCVEDLQTLKSLLLALMLDCKASNWPILYLGLPLGGNPKASGFWDPVIERISRRLDGWQKAYLSFGGVGEGKRDHLVSWDVVCKPKVKGGLGFGKFSLRNLALLGKWLWRYHRENSALWHQVILSIYGTHSKGWDANTVVKWSHHCPWKAIAQVFQDFSKYTRFVVGDGEIICFWEDLW
ncbi:putative mitochondrial protein [Vitis vinifera]|uniref:Putative mitochondrial protein n=1 Tax=Vitis vinifera TaxID=29760 RepID=A0A438HFN5_VITVI|nr:putative mitochondrial protein [Vitis vinifera]